ncbi:RB-associated KRAB zinc finger protein, partial [Operophtera brumata]
FAHLNSLRRHLRAHSGERNHLCNVCGKALSSREHLKFHIRIHTGYKPNVCNGSNRLQAQRLQVSGSNRLQAQRLQPHVCSHCGKAFSQRSTLVIHERYHSGARPYACALCGRGFVAKGLLSMHLKTTCIWYLPVYIHPRAVPQRRKALRVRALRPRLRGQGAALHAPQDHLHM